MALYTSDIQESLRDIKNILDDEHSPNTALFLALESAFEILVELLEEYGVDTSEFYDGWN